MKNLIKLNIMIYITLLLSLWVTSANSVAFCALRDPVKNIYNLFPEANNYRSITHKLDKKIQQQVKKKLPFTLHQDELGKHTIYVALKNKVPIGLIHSRSEIGLWGLVEIVWAFDFKLKVVDFTFQRCRESSCKLMLAENFQYLLKNKSSEQLLALLTKPNSSYPKTIANNKEAMILAKTIIRSALKTAQVTQAAWPKELKHYLNKSIL
jgi:hypothetical protein